MSDGDKCVPPQWRHWQGRAQFLCSAQSLFAPASARRASCAYEAPRGEVIRPARSREASDHGPPGVRQGARP